MTYTYECICGATPVDVNKSVTQIDMPEFCSCGHAMRRVILPVNFHVKNATFQSGYNPSLGQSFGTIQEQDSFIREVQDTTGRELVEVGNETLESETVRKEYDGQDAAEWLRSAEKNPNMIKGENG